MTSGKTVSGFCGAAPGAAVGARPVGCAMARTGCNTIPIASHRTANHRPINADPPDLLNAGRPRACIAVFFRQPHRPATPPPRTAVSEKALNQYRMVRQQDSVPVNPQSRRHSGTLYGSAPGCPVLKLQRYRWLFQRPRCLTARHAVTRCGTLSANRSSRLPAFGRKRFASQPALGKTMRCARLASGRSAEKSS